MERTHPSHHLPTMPGLSADTLEIAVQKILGDFSDVLAIYLFGSVAQQHATADSDIDIAIRTTQKIPSRQLWSTSTGLAQLFQRDVDLVDILSASTVMRMQMVSRGTRLYCADQIECDTYDNYIYSSYARLNEERSGILEDIAKRGTVYG